MNTISIIYQTVIVLCLSIFCWCCPSACVCKWKGGKQTVECLNKGLITIPDGMDPGSQVLEFSGNNLQILPRERFQRLGLLNLQRIYLSRCKLGQIDERAFRGLTNLVELDLSENFLSYMPSETFHDYPNLMRLTMSNNPIRKIKTRSFQPLSTLESLEISNCELEVIEGDAFLGLEKLEWLKLDGNRLTTLRGTHLLPASLHGVALNHNPWHCDCKLIELHNWLLNFNIPHSIEPKCKTPFRLADQIVKDLDVMDFACIPDVSPTTMYLEIAEGKNISLLCQVTAIPEAKVSWWYQGRVLQNDSMLAPGLHLYYYVEAGTEEKKSELFIFNTNTEDNGTFICLAENPAGQAQSNYTIRIIVKKEVEVEVVLQFEYLIFAIAAIAILAIIILIVLILLIVRCRMRINRARKQSNAKTVTLQPQEPEKTIEVDANMALNRMQKFNISTASPLKLNGVQPAISDRRQDAAACESISRMVFSPSSPFRISCPTERNPDLINDTADNQRKRRDDVAGYDRMIQEHSSYKEAMENIIEDIIDIEESIDLRCRAGPEFPLRALQPNRPRLPAAYTTLPRRCLASNITQFIDPNKIALDEHMNPENLLDKDGYPIDFGLPRLNMTPQMEIPTERGQPHPNLYRTLQYKKTQPHRKIPQYPREAECLPGPTYVGGYENGATDIRYSVEGYPTSAPQVFPTTDGYDATNNFIPSPPAAYKSDNPVTLSSCDPEWAAPLQSEVSHKGNQHNTVENAINDMVNAPVDLSRVQQESPDEGFGEDGTEI